jgi:hypothetical protein
LSVIGPPLSRSSIPSLRPGVFYSFEPG